MTSADRRMSDRRKIRLTAIVLIHVVFLSTGISYAEPDSTVTSGYEYDRPASEDQRCNCKFPKHHQTSEAALNRLKPLCGNRYVVEDIDHGYVYNVGICTKSEPTLPALVGNAGVTQRKKNDVQTSPYSVGSFEQAELMTGSSWLILEYEGGDKFHQHCGYEDRRTVIMILCKPGEKTGQLRLIEENSNKSADCYYLFELDHDAGCPVETDSRLSVGSIICIVFFTTVGLYLILGFLYMRCIRGAKGLYQIPNYGFWRDFGALQSDGCNLVCRCGDQRPESKYYHGIGDHQIESANEIEERDDHLLPM